MWLLTCDGNLFNGKPVWLRPGSGHLLGRTSGRVESGEVVRFIENKSVSRKHATIHVGHVKDGDSARLHARSEVTITDNSKVGTFVNGEKVLKETKTLEKTENVIKLGNYADKFYIKWVPVALTFTSLPKGAKGRSKVLDPRRQQLEQTDIKLLEDYVANQTSHVVAKKRNTSAGLQALLQGKWMVDANFVDALAAATKKEGRDANGDEKRSLLEEDFQDNWPKEEAYIAPPGGEPVPRPAELLKPNPERAEIFSQYLFIMLTQYQYDDLFPVVSSGGGKALLWEVESGVSKVDDLIDYVREAAGAKRNTAFTLSQPSGKGGIVVVRPRDRDEWLDAFQRDLDIELQQRSIEQNEFLDAILTLKPGELRKPLRHSESRKVNEASRASQHVSPRQEQTPQSTPQPPANTRASEQSQPVEERPAQSPHRAMEPPARRKPRRIITQTRAQDFEEFDESQVVPPSSDSDSEPEPASAPDPSQASALEDAEPSQSVRTQQSSRKRPAPVDPDQTEKDMLDNMLPGAAAYKRRKTAAQQNGARGPSASATPEPDAVRSATAAAKRPLKKQKDIDVAAELKARRDKEEELRRQDEEATRAALEDTDIRDVRAKVETFDLPVRQPPQRPAHDNGAGPSDRWNPAWNGRKNFKRFRRQGQNNDGPRLQRVIVALEEVPRKGHGIGDEYWLNPSSNRNKSKSQSQSQAVSQGVVLDGSDDDPNRFRRRIQNSRREDQEQAELDAISPDEIAGRPRDSGIQAAISQTLGTESQRRAAGKRPAADQGGPAAKKAKQSRLASSRAPARVDDDEEDELKFRRRKR